LSSRLSLGVPKYGFAAYFALLTLIFVASAVATVVFVHVQTDRDARRQAGSDARFAAKAAAKQLGEDIGLLRATVNQLAANPGIAGVLAKPEDCTLTFGGPGETGKGHLDLLAMNGVATCSSRPRGNDGRLHTYAGESWVRAAAAAPIFQGPLTDKVTGAPVVVSAAPASGKVIVAGLMDISSVGSHLEAIYGGNREAEFLVLTAGAAKVVTRSSEPRRWIGSSVEGTAFGAAAGKAERPDLDGKDRIYASAPVPGTQWKLFVGEDKARALAAGTRLRNRQLAIALSSLALLLLATLFVYRRVVRPMKQLSDGVKSTAARGRFTPVTVSGPAEVTGLATEINALMVSVNAQEAVRLAKEEAERANEAKSQFLSHMSHELRTPIAAILGFAELLERNAAGEKERLWTGYIAQSGQHLLALVNELLEISRIEAGKMTLAIEPVDLRSTVDEVLGLAAPLAAERHIRLQQTTNGTPDRAALADPMRLRQVLLNLVSNAIKYNREAGTVSVSVEERNEGSLLVAVTDTGEGMAPETLDRLFSPFERLGAEDTAVEGSGLGLVVTKGLVEAMHGRLQVQSEVGVGTTFSFDLPTEDAATKRPGPAPIAAPVGGSATEGDVLYIDDNPANLQLVKDILADSRPGLSLRTATEGTAGAELAEQRRPDLLLLDLNLADMTGEEVLRRLRARNETVDVPILILSADSSSRNVTRLLQTGADAYLTKPLHRPQFLEVVDGLLATR